MVRSPKTSGSDQARHTVLPAQLHGLPHGRPNTILYASHHVVLTLEIRYKQARLDMDRRADIESADEGRDVQIVSFCEPFGTEPMITVVSGPVMLGTQWDG